MKIIGIILALMGWCTLTAILTLSIIPILVLMADEDIKIKYFNIPEQLINRL